MSGATAVAASAETPVVTGAGGSFAATGRLVRLALRRDRVQLPIWIGSAGFLMWVSAVSVLALYPTEEDRVEFVVASSRSAVVLALNGLISGTSAGALLTSQALLVMTLIAAFLGTLTVVRHTRGDEQAGRVELVGAASVGRLAPLTAAVIVAGVAEVALGLASVLACLANGLPLDGSLLFGAATATCGMAFAGVAAITAQIASRSRAANGLAATVIGVAFGLRTIGDISGEVVDGGIRVESGWPSWLSPLGWAAQTRAFDLDQWWVLVLPVGFSVACVAVAYALRVRRDLGAGLVPERPGPPRAARTLLSPEGLTWRLQRTVVAGWSVALVVVAASYGAIGPDVDDFLGSSQANIDIFESLGGGRGMAAALRESYMAATLGITAMMIAAAGVQLVARAHPEESDGLLGLLLTSAVARGRWLLGHVALAAVTTVVLLLACGAVTGAAYALAGGFDVAEETWRYTWSSLVWWPSVLVVLGAAATAHGLVPRHSRSLAWTAYMVFLLLYYLGATLDLPQWLRDLTPFSHTPAAPVQEVRALPLVAMGAVAVGLLGVALVALRRRDITG